MSNKFSPGLLSGIHFEVDEETVKYKISSLFKTQTEILSKDSIKSIIIEPGKGVGSAELKFIGEDIILGSIETTALWATKSQLWLLNELNL